MVARAIQLPTRPRPEPEAVHGTRRDVDEGTCRTTSLFLADEDQVLTFEYVERLGGIPVYVHRRPKAGSLGCLELFPTRQLRD